MCACLANLDYACGSQRNWKDLREKFKLNNNPALTVDREEIERAVTSLLDTPDDFGSSSDSTD